MSTIEKIEKEKIILILRYLKQRCHVRYWYWKDNREFVEALCGMYITLPKWMDKYIHILGGGVGPTCAACCGYLSMDREEHGDFVTYAIVPCYCHPWGNVTINLPVLEDDIREFAKKIADSIEYY